MRDAEIRNLNDLRKFGKRVRAEGGPKLHRRLNTKMRAAARPALAAAREAALAIPAKGPEHHGIRRRIAKTLTIRTSRGRVRVRADGRKMPDGKKMLPRLFEGPKPIKWPIYGDRTNWGVRPAHPWFYPAMRRTRTQVVSGVRRGAAEVLAELRRGMSK